ncbi:molecular chaperone [Marinomonas sp. THO17]|uniref:molecular chaperone n=1 Tax=Marinomonas sp. THO17 TaxID=3149048 RepID=UPI00336BB938
MICGFDYGTSNCALGVMADQQVRLLPLEANNAFLPSTLYALDRDLITEFVVHHMPFEDQRQALIDGRQAVLNRAQRVRREEDIKSSDQTLFFGRAAFAEYFEFPEEGYFVKSPKSFLGSSGLRKQHTDFFEDVVTCMMQNVKRSAEAQTGQTLTHAVIGRPVNFQGINAEQSNQQALQILTTASHRAGFKSVEFLYEPIAAGLDFETKLEADKTVLVVDIGGGTTDCAMVRMGPSYRDKLERKADFLAHTGERIGGNDLDINIAAKHFMPLFGMESPLKTGLPMPTQIYWNAVMTNDVTAMTTFNSLQSEQQIEDLMRDAKQPGLLERFARMRENKQNFHIVRNAEEGKIALSQQQNHTIHLDYIEAGLLLELERQAVALSIATPLQKMLVLMSQAIEQAREQPDLIYITGGSAQSPIIRAAIEERIGQVPVIDGDHFGSVAAGLTVWAERLFR